MGEENGDMIIFSFWPDVIMVKEIASAIRNQTGLVGALKRGLRTIGLGLNSGSRNMLSVAIATATAGIIVGAVSQTGVGLVLADLVEVLSQSQPRVMFMAKFM